MGKIQADVPLTSDKETDLSYEEKCDGFLSFEVVGYDFKVAIH